MPTRQRQIWPHLGIAKNLGYCLYGGTALALRFGHRESIDFDFFSSQDLNKDSLIDAMPILQGAITLEESKNTFIVLATLPDEDESVKLSFFGGIRFGRVCTPDMTEDGVLLVASLRDLMATKLKVLFDRVELKDYIDIAQMLNRRQSLALGISDAMALLPRISPSYCLKTLCYFDAKELSELSRKYKQILTSAVRETSSSQSEFQPSSIASTELIL